MSELENMYQEPKKIVPEEARMVSASITEEYRINICSFSVHGVMTGASLSFTAGINSLLTHTMIDVGFIASLR